MTSAGPTLLGPADVRALAARLGVRPTKQRGQNFVIDANTVRRIVREAALEPDDVVVEVGPGLGSLTLALLAEVRRVVAIEVDPVLAEALPETLAAHAPGQAGRCEVLTADALRIETVPGPAPTALVANLPYNISVPVLLHLLSLLPSLERGLVMVQSEVADRLAAVPGSKVYGIPSVKAAWYADVRRAGSVGRNVFWPAPNVDSGLVAWTRREPPSTTASRAEVFAVVDAAFAHRRKVLRGALRDLAGSGEAAEAALRKADVEPTARGESLTVVEFARIAEALDVSITVRAAAKINLLLGVGAPRPDGFHTLVTVYQAISLYDDLTVALSSGDADELTVTTEVAPYIDSSHLPESGHNIVDRAAAALSGHHGRPVAASLHVTKNIPVAGGLAGGSADGAAALVALDRLHDLRTTDDDLLQLAAGLGSDVPFALVGGSALGEGHGEVVTRVDDQGAWWWVVVPSTEGLSTPAVYRHHDELRPDAPVLPGPPDEVVDALAAGDVRRLAAALHNDLEQAACDLRSDLAQLIVEGVDAGALRGLVSGSGPTCVFLCESADHARSVAGALTDADDQRVVLVAHGPVAGAHVLAQE